MKNLRIKNTLPVQEDFWGNGAIYHGYAGMPDDADRVYSDELCAIEAKRATDMRLKIARTFYKWWAWDKETNTWDWDNEIMTPFYRWLQRMKDGNVTIALNCCWCSPGDVNSSFWNGPGPFNVPGDWEASIKNYGDWVSESVHQLVEVRGFTNIKILVMFTEPQNLNGTPTVADMDAYTCWYQATKAAHEALVRDGRRDMVKLMGPNEGSTVTSDMLKWVSKNCEDFIDIYSSHNYLNTKPIPYGLVEENAGAISHTIAGGRFYRQINLKAGKEYTVNIDFKFASKVDTPNGKVIFGVFEDKGINDIYSNEEDILFAGTEQDSVKYVDSKDIAGADSRFTYKIISSEDKTALVGFFHDVKTEGVSVVTKLEILDEEGTPLYDNADFKNEGRGWNVYVCADYSDNYNAWCRWCNTGMQYVPEGRPFCFDEYNAAYNWDKSVINHGADVVTGAVALMNCGVQSSLLWTLFDQQWPNNHATNNDCFVDGDHRWGVMPLLTRSLVPHHAFYAFGLFSRYIDGEGTKVFKGLGEHRIYTTMSVSKEGYITVVVVNDKEVDDEFTLTFEKALEGVKFNRHTYSPESCIPNEKAELPGIDKITNPITTTLTDKIAAYGVTIYTTHMD